MSKKISIFAAIAICFFISVVIFSAGKTFAQEETGAAVDMEIIPEDLGVKKAKVLPGTFFYNFKDFFRNTQETFTRDPVKKAELQMQHANEKIIEVQQLVGEKKTEKAAAIAAGVIKGINKNLGKIANSENLKKAKAKDGARVDKFLDKVADQSLKQQVVLQRLQEQVPEKSFARIEEARQQHLEKFGQVMTKVSGNSGELAQRVPQIIENREGSDFKELKVVEILRDLEDKVPEEAKDALRQAQSVLSQRFEQRFAAIPPEIRKEKLQSYVESMPGNGARQFEAFDRMKESFKSEGMAKEMELAKDKAFQKFENQFSQFQEEESRKSFMQPWQNGSPESLRTMTEIEMRMEPAEGKEALKPDFQNFQQFRQETQNNFKERFEQNPEQLKQNPVFQKMENRPDIVDLKMSQDLVKIFAPEERKPIQGMPPEGTPSASNFMRDFQKQTDQKFIENAGRRGFESVSGPPVRGGLKVLEEIKERAPIQAQGGLDRAIEAQTKNIRQFKKNNEEIRQSGEIKLEPPQRPIVPITQERVEMFKDIAPVEQKPAPENN